MKSYTAGKLGSWRRLDELRVLTRSQFGHMDERAAAVVRELDETDEKFRTLLDFPVEHRRLLVVGTGQHAEHQLYFSQRNRAVGIDVDFVPTRITPASIVAMTRENGAVRTLKTVGRKSLGIDRQFRRAMARELHVATLEPPEVLRMDATRMTFPDASFDCAFSKSVFEHIPDPEPAIREIGRVLAPGGACFIGVHLYAAENGHHDLRFPDHRDGIPYWAHLRPHHEHTILPAAYLNKIRLDDWKEMFSRNWPGVVFEPPPAPTDELRTELERVRAAGELAGYSDDELLTTGLNVWWRKPADANEENR